MEFAIQYSIDLRAQITFDGYFCRIVETYKRCEGRIEIILGCEAIRSGLPASLSSHARTSGADDFHGAKLNQLLFLVQVVLTLDSFS